MKANQSDVERRVYKIPTVADAQIHYVCMMMQVKMCFFLFCLYNNAVLKRDQRRKEMEYLNAALKSLSSCAAAAGRFCDDICSTCNISSSFFLTFS